MDTLLIVTCLQHNDYEASIQCILAISDSPWKSSDSNLHKESAQSLYRGYMCLLKYKKRRNVSATDILCTYGTRCPFLAGYR